jgi:hypothetical protein
MAKKYQVRPSSELLLSSSMSEMPSVVTLRCLPHWTQHDISKIHVTQAKAIILMPLRGGL